MTWTSSDGSVSLRVGDCLERMAEIPDDSVDCVVMDPPWPEGYWENADALFAAAVAEMPRLTKRLVVHLGCDSDPRFLRHVPSSLPFLRVCWLEYVRPHYKGRLLYTGDVAYVFGAPPLVKDGQFLMPGKLTSTQSYREDIEHPCPRQISFVRWLVKWFGGAGPVLDPFIGSGTTAVAAVLEGFRCVGIDNNAEYITIAQERVERAILVREHGSDGAAAIEDGQGVLL